MNSRESLAFSAVIGALAGLRAFTPPAILSQAARHNLIGLRRSRLRLLRSPVAANILTSLAIGELVGDKLPFTPSRLAIPSLPVRAASGALCGSVISGAGRKGRLFTSKSCRGKSCSPLAMGAIVGALGAIGGAFAGFHLRREIKEHFGVPDPAIAVVEDLLTIAGAVTIVSKKASVLSLATAGVL
jgi:uncharacterized membrane protein